LPPSLSILVSVLAGHAGRVYDSAPHFLSWSSCFPSDTLYLPTLARSVMSSAASARRGRLPWRNAASNRSRRSKSPLSAIVLTRQTAPVLLAKTRNIEKRAPLWRVIVQRQCFVEARLLQASAPFSERCSWKGLGAAERLFKRCLTMVEVELADAANIILD